MKVVAGMKKAGWVKLYRSILEWEWYKDVVVRSLFIHLILTVNTEDEEHMGVVIPRGSRVFSLDSLATETGFSKKQIRRGLAVLEKENVRARKGHRLFSILTLKNYDALQQKGTHRIRRKEERRIIHGIRIPNLKKEKEIKNKEKEKENEEKKLDERAKYFDNKAIFSRNKKTSASGFMKVSEILFGKKL